MSHVYGFECVGGVALDVYLIGVALMYSMSWLRGIYSLQPLKWPLEEVAENCSFCVCTRPWTLCPLT
jgi:hypothetical protein